MQPARFSQADFLLVEINNAKFTSPAVNGGEERGLFSRTAVGNRAYAYTNKWRVNKKLTITLKNHYT